MRTYLGFIGICTLCTGVFGQDWPQFRGPLRDGHAPASGLKADWPSPGPALVQTIDGLGVGYAGPAIMGDRLYIAGGINGKDMLLAYDISAAPKQLWTVEIGPLFQWAGNQWNAGPNITPTVHNGFVYALGGAGDLICVDAQSGKTLWKVNFPRDLGGQVNPIGGGQEEPTPLGWGYAGAPLVDQDQLICLPGGPQGLFAALDLKTGKTLWRSKTIPDQASYASPIRMEIDGQAHYVAVINRGLVGVSRNGTTLWEYNRANPYDDCVIATPVAAGDTIFASVGFAQGCDLLKLRTAGAKFTVEKILSNKAVENRDGGMVAVAGHVYGHSDNKGWFCLELATGKMPWTQKDTIGRGSLVYADGHLILLPENGKKVVRIEANPKEWVQKGEFGLPAASKNRKPSGMLWTHPVIAHGKLWIRDQETLRAYQLK
jgi:outer membrane protein assembly factor BamB